MEQQIGSIGYGPPTHAEMQILAWQESPGVAWLMQIQRDTPVPSAYDLDLDLVALEALIVIPGQPEAPPPAPVDAFTQVAATFRWADR